MLGLRYQLSRLKPRHRGLGLTTLGFLVGCLGASMLVAFDLLFEWLGYEVTWIRSTALILGWSVLIAGTLATVVGIVMHWFLMWRRDE